MGPASPGEVGANENAAVIDSESVEIADPLIPFMVLQQVFLYVRGIERAQADLVGAEEFSDSEQGFVATEVANHGDDSVFLLHFLYEPKCLFIRQKTRLGAGGVAHGEQRAQRWILSRRLHVQFKGNFKLFVEKLPVGFPQRVPIAEVQGNAIVVGNAIHQTLMDRLEGFTGFGDFGGMRENVFDRRAIAGIG